MGDSETQLLHGDFSDQNLISTADGLRVFDFDGCGYGPIEYDVANSLYMVLFDADVNGGADEYEAFRPSFLVGYAAVSGRHIEHDVIDRSDRCPDLLPRVARHAASVRARI